MKTNKCDNCSALVTAPFHKDLEKKIAFVCPRFVRNAHAQEKQLLLSP